MSNRFRPVAWIVAAAILLSAVCVYGQGGGGGRDRRRGPDGDPSRTGGGFGQSRPGSPSGGAPAAPSSRASVITSLDARFDPSVVEYVNEKLLKVQDKNGDGNIDKAEWTAAGTWSKSNPPENSDLNKDGKLSREELYIRKSKSEGLPIKGETASSSSPSGSSPSFGPPGSPPGGPPRGGSSGFAKKADKAAGTDKKSYRFLTPTERLPKGMSDEFLKSDADGDGQIMMHEFSTSWTEATAARFTKFDADGDGIITPNEWLAVEPKK